MILLRSHKISNGSSFFYILYYMIFFIKLQEEFDQSEEDAGVEEIAAPENNSDNNTGGDKDQGVQEEIGDDPNNVPYSPPRSQSTPPVHYSPTPPQTQQSMIMPTQTESSGGFHKSRVTFFFLI